MSGLIGKKIGMTSLFDTTSGKRIPCTVLEMGPCYVTQVKTTEVDGYKALQLGYLPKREKNVNASLKGHFKKAGVPNLTKLVEFKYFEEDYKVGTELKADTIFAEGEFVDAIANSKGKGFAGVVRRYNFAGVGGQTHGQHNRARHPGSIGACSFPSRVFKGMRMGGRMGNDQVKVQNLRVLKLFPEKNLVLVSGSVPGHKNTYVLLEK